MIRPVRFAILALLILGVFAAGAALDWSASTRTEVQAIELQPAPPTELTGELATPISRTSPAKAKSADRKSRGATPEVRPVSPPEPARAPTRVAARSQPAVQESPEAARPTAASAPKKTPTADNPGSGGTTPAPQPKPQPQPQPPPTEAPAPQTPTTGAAPAPTTPEPAGDEDDDDDDDDGDDGGDDD